MGARFARPQIRYGAQILFGVACAAAMIGLRTVLDVWAAAAGPFALVYPTVLIATLYGHLRGGIAAYLISFAWGWYVVLPAHNSFSFELASDPTRVAINAGANLVVLLFAEAFRRAVRSAMMERDEEISRRAVLLAELEHRTKNNFALAASLLEMQKRRETHPATQEALDQALARIHSFASAYANLAAEQGEGAIVDMNSYLRDVVRRMSGGGFGDNVHVTVNASHATLPREVAVAIGLFTNEALTNCAKYAFPDGQDGKVDVRFTGDASDWRLSVSDNGRGSAGDAQARDGQSGGAAGGLGKRLLSAFAGQARAQYDFALTETGCTLTLVSQADR